MLDDLNIAVGLSFASFLVMAFVIWHRRTGLLGFTVISFISIASGSLSGFLYGWANRLDDYWITHAHIFVFTYSAAGLLAYALGVWLAWRPLTHDNSPIADLSDRPWFNERFVLICSGLGMLAYLSNPIASSIPTVQAVWSTYMELLNFGVLLAVVYALNTQNYRILIFSLGGFILFALGQATLSGHIGAGGLFTAQIAMAFALWKRPGFRALGVTIVSFLLFMSLLVGWMDSRDIIRSGSLENLGVAERISTFINGFEFTNPLALNPDRVQDTLKTRVDMSTVLVAQSLYQPSFQPYENGNTIFSDLLIVLVPRFIWADKPVRLGGNEFASRYSGLIWDEFTSVSLPYQFELYANGGIAWVICGLFVIGWLTAYCELQAVKEKKSLAWFLVWLVFATNLAGTEHQITTMIMAAVSGALGIYVLGKGLESFQQRWLTPKPQ